MTPGIADKQFRYDEIDKVRVPKLNLLLGAVVTVQAQIEGLGTMAVQDANAVAITGGTAQLTGASSLTGATTAEATFRAVYTGATSTSATARFQAVTSQTPSAVNHRIGTFLFTGGTPTAGEKNGASLIAKALAAWTDTDTRSLFQFNVCPAGSTTAVEAMELTNTHLNLASGVVLKANGNQVVGARKSGWSVDTGTAKRTANATYSATANATYNQAQIQTLMDAVRDATQTIKALKDDLHQTAGHGLIGT